MNNQMHTFSTPTNKLNFVSLEFLRQEERKDFAMGRRLSLVVLYAGQATE